MSRSIFKSLSGMFPTQNRRPTRRRSSLPSHRFLPLAVERLEDRTLLSTVSPVAALDFSDVDVQPMIVAGYSPDSPADRVDPNTDPAFGGVGSIFAMRGGKFGYLGTGTLIDSTHVLTAAHLLDLNDNGTIDVKPKNVTFYLNYGTDFSHEVKAAELYIHPDYTGFAQPSVNDDVAIITLRTPIDDVPTYGLAETLALGQTMTLVGYGTTGTPDGYISGSASFTVKRSGQNDVGVFEGQDDVGQPTANEVWLADFDGPDSSTDYFGDGLTRGNNVETTLGGGDSGGPGFIEVDGSLLVASVNTFTTTDAPSYGSLLGGMNVSAYVGWIDAVLSDGGGGGGGGPGNGGGNGKGNGKGPKPKFAMFAAVDSSVAVAPFVDISLFEARHTDPAPAQLPVSTTTALLNMEVAGEVAQTDPLYASVDAVWETEFASVWTDDDVATESDLQPDEIDAFFDGYLNIRIALRAIPLA